MKRVAVGSGGGFAQSSAEDGCPSASVPTLLVGAVSLVPCNAVAGVFRADTVALLKQLRPSILR
jgi:hypothetical protein